MVRRPCATSGSGARRPGATTSLVCAGKQPESGPDFAALRVALVAQPDSAERNIAEALAYLEHGEERKADFLNRVRRFGGDHLIRHTRAQSIVARKPLAALDAEAAVPWLEQAAQAHDPDTLLQLGVL